MVAIRNLTEFSSEMDAFFSNTKVTSQGTYVYPPNVSDLYSLYLHVRNSKSVAVLEFGSGWSTLVLAKALSENFSEFGDLINKGIRHPNPFRLMTVDCEQHFLDLSVSRVPQSLGIEILPINSVAYMSQIRGQICTFYKNLPAFTADFIYLDGPDCGPSQIIGDIDGFSINFGDKEKLYGLPMAGDLIRLEPFLWPGTVILTDGRGANANFLKSNFRRNWNYKYDYGNDQHLFYLAEPAWGKYSLNLLELKGTLEIHPW